MNPDRWQQIDRLLDEVLDRKPEERPAFLEQACAGDPELRREVEALLEAHAKAGSFVQKPVLNPAAAPRQNHAMGSLVGKRLGPYEVFSLIGRGGMGEVYQARDTRLGRSVALKILPPEFVTDEERMHRFRREAKAASALSHANVATIYDVGESEGTHYIAMEYVERKTLGELIGHKGMRLSDALNYGVQIADALAAAHEAGIVHRDLKPGNVMVTAKGQVKVLDFGLAKWKEKVSSGGEDSEATGQPTTEEGRIVGTVAYMSPEQAEGKPVDARSDIFSFGSVLYEMVTGRRAFEGYSRVSTLSAILKEEPKPASEVSAKVPKEVERLISRCLKKDPERRFQHMNDLRVELQELKEDSDLRRLLAEPVESRPPKRAHRVIGAAAIVTIIALAVAGWYWLGRQRSAESEGPLVPVPLTSYPGYEDYPSFSPDGTQVAFRWCTTGSSINCDIYIRQVGVEQPPFRLTTDPADDFNPAWSPDGQLIAFLRRLSPTRAALILMPQRGGRERTPGEMDLADVRAPYLAWTPDSNHLVVAGMDAGSAGPGLTLLTLDDERRQRLTDRAKDTSPAVSPDGRNLAFVRFQPGTSEIFLLRLTEGYEPNGAPEKIAQCTPVCSGVTWTPDGKDLVFSSGSLPRGYASSLWRVPASKSAQPRRLSLGTENASLPVISARGNRLAYTSQRADTDIWTADLKTAGASKPLISSTQSDEGPEYSPDGQKIAFVSNRSGSDEVWLCDSNGANPVPLTSFGGSVFGPRFSPDGGRIAFTAFPGGNGDVYVVSSKGGVSRRLTNHPAFDRWACWSPDGQWLYFLSNRSGSFQFWRMPASGGEAVQLTSMGQDFDTPAVSSDGEFLYYAKGAPERCSVWRIPSVGGEETRVLDSVHPSGQWTVVAKGIYFVAWPDERGRSDVRFYDFVTGKIAKMLTLEGRIGFRITVSPDGRTLLYTHYDQGGSDLMLVENFR